MTYFDLQAAQDPRYANQIRWARRIGASMITIFSALAVLIVVEDLIHRTGWSVPILLLLGVDALIIAVSMVGFQVSHPSAQAVELTEHHVAFRYSNGAVWRLAWRDPRFRLSLHKLSYFNGIPRNPPVQLAIGAAGVRNLLTEAAYNEVIRTALAHGLRVSQGRGGRFGPGIRYDWVTTIRSSSLA